MKPIIVRQRSTDRWFILTRYDIAERLNPATGQIEKAYTHRNRHEVTDQMEAILRWFARRVASLTDPAAPATEGALRQQLEAWHADDPPIERPVRLPAVKPLRATTTSGDRVARFKRRAGSER